MNYKNEKRREKIMLSVWLMTFFVCMVFYIFCGEISFKPSKQKLIVTPIFSLTLIAMAYMLTA
jgi:hypothetical protein